MSKPWAEVLISALPEYLRRTQAERAAIRRQVAWLNKAVAEAVAAPDEAVIVINETQREEA